jgi:4'-phosphopantetheinyl transferase
MAAEPARTNRNADPESTSSLPRFHLGGEDVHIWTAGLDLPEHKAAGFYALLSDDEKARAARFHFEKDRLHFIAGRATLRMLVAGYLGRQPAKVQFSYTSFGKPFLKSVSGESEYQFNLSHSNDRVVYIFSLARQVGIDLEQIRVMPDQDRFAEFYYSRSECAAINALDILEKRRAFYKIWTCKEAVFKAIGAGLTKEISQTEVSLNGDAQPRLVCIDGDPAQAVGWHLELFAPFENYQAAFAIQEGSGRQVIFQPVDGLFGAV